MVNAGFTPSANRTICIFFSQDTYETVVNNAPQYRNHLNEAIQNHPELFPDQIGSGYELKDRRESVKLKITIRRILVSGVSYSVRPSFAMPYMTGFTENVEKPLFLRKFAVPFWAITHCYGKYEMYRYRNEITLGRFGIVGTTVKIEKYLPRHLAADEKHTSLSGEKVYVPVTVGDGCVLGAAVTYNADHEDLQKAYGIFKKEAADAVPGYSPETVNTDGWKATVNAWKNLFPSITVLSCFLHIFISIRDRCSKKFRDIFTETADKLWNCYHAETKASFSQKVRRLFEWSRNTFVPPVIADKIKKLYGNLPSFSAAYNFPDAHRTSNMVDRLMQRSDRYLFSTQYFHGNITSANQSVRAWALVQNFAPSNPYTVLKYDGLKSPAERLNGFCYHDNWLHNLLISASLGGYRASPQNPL